MYIGSMEKGPYASLETNHYLDRDGVDIVSYLQDNYTVQKSSNANYGYSTPYKFVDDKEVKQPEPLG
ncbi:MAG: hypothetical protein MJ219_02015 [Mycoplasmoidaceae bacterium]|nr:hypothetical protein [Mycoplasmoidaceae bacterium]